MLENEGWLSQNLVTQFPFREALTGVDGAVPHDLFLDLKLFLAGNPDLQVYLSSLAYDATADAYTLTFTSIDGEGTLFTGTITRLKAGITRIFNPQYLISGETSLLFTPGPIWDNPAWNGGGSWTANFSPAQAALEPSVINPGAEGFRGIFIDGATPPEDEWPLESTFTLSAGYNIGLALGTGLFAASGPFNTDAAATYVDISAGGGLGLGYPPADDVTPYLATINQTGPDGNGNFVLAGNDCLRVSQPSLAGEPIANTLQINSDCLPCCPCDQYQAVSNAISRLSAKVVDACDLLNTILQNSATSYNDGVETINKKRPPMIQVRNIRALGSQLIFGVQNASEAPAFAYVAIGVSPNLGAMEVTTGQPNVETGQTATTSLPAMAAVSGENPGNSLPVAYKSLPFQLLITVGQTLGSTAFGPIQPGTNIDVTINFPALATSLAALVAGGASDATIQAATLPAHSPIVTFQSAGVYGASKCFACTADLYQVKFQPNSVPVDPIVSSLCSVDLQTQYVAVVVPLA